MNKTYKMKALKKLILFFLLIFNNLLIAQNNCGNVDFETGTNTGWTGYIGTCANGPSVGQLPTINIPNTVIPWTTPQYYEDNSGFNTQIRWQIMAPDSGNNGFDENIPFIPVVSPWGGTRSIKLGNNQVGNLAERLRYQYTVDASNANFVYQYAVILEDANHDSNEQPAFRIKITNASGTIINPTCGVYNVYSGQSGVGFSTYTPPGAFTPLSYRNWSLASIDLTPFIGTTITLEFTTNDCTLGGHYGYAYIDCSCIPLQLATAYCSGAATADVTAPDGYISYSWTADSAVNYPPPTGPLVPIGNVLTTDSTIIIPSYDITTTYTVNLIPYQGFQCATQLDYIFNPIATLEAGFGFLAFCGNTPSQFLDSAVIQNNGAPANAWDWYFGDGDSSNLQNPTHLYPILPYDTTYNVTYIVYAGSSCKDTLVKPVFVPSGLTIDTLQFSNVKCFGIDNGFVSFDVSGSPGANLTYSWNLPNPPPTITTTDTIQSAYGIQANSASGIPMYWFFVQDIANGCSDSLGFVVTEPALLTNSIANNYILCLGSSGSLTTVIGGGTPPYSIAWQTAPSQDSVTAINLLAGTYSVEITDTNNCTSSAFGTLIDGSVLNHEIIISPISCHGFNDGKVSVRLFDGKPSYKIRWVIPGIPPYDTNSDKDSVLSLNRLNGYVVLINQNNCDPDTVTFSITEPDTLQALITTTNASCLVAKNGAVKVDVVGGIQPYSYLWTTDTDKNSQGVNNLYQGIDTVTITDANNCEIQAIAVVGYDSNFVVTAKPDFVYDAQANNNLWVTVDKPGNYTYTWNNAEAINDSTIADPLLSQVFFPLDFRIDVIDEFGCSGFDSVYVDAVPFIYIPSAFSPNGDKLNDTLEIAFSNFKISNFSLNVYDRWGGKVFATQNPKFKWDGKVDYKDATIGMYNYDISYVDNRNKNQKLRGAFTLIR